MLYIEEEDDEDECVWGESSFSNVPISSNQWYEMKTDQSWKEKPQA